MIKKLHFKLSVVGIKKNFKLYMPYSLTSAFMIFIYFSMVNLVDSKVLVGSYGDEVITSILGFGVIVIGFFSLIFLNYTNKFILKNRKEEYGLFSMLGLSKKDLFIVVTIESIIISVVNILLGLIYCLVLGKLFILVISSIFGTPEILKFIIVRSSVISTVLVFSVIFAAILFDSLWSMRKFNPINYLNDSKGGEKEPQSKIILATLGFIALASGYILAVMINDPTEALMYFFIAVILVIIGTFALFTFFSVVFLKALRKKNSYYSKKKFIYISTMIYRIKQNALSLASICILCTMVLVTVVTTVSLYAGKNSILDNITPGDINFISRTSREKDFENLFGQLSKEYEEKAKSIGLTIENRGESLYFSDEKVPNKIDKKVLGSIYGENKWVHNIFMENIRAYKNHNKKDVTLKDNEVIILTNNREFKESKIILDNKEYNIVGIEKLKNNNAMIKGMKIYVIVVNKLENHMNLFKDKGNILIQTLYYDFHGNVEQINSFVESVKDKENINIKLKSDSAKEIQELYGGLLVLGGFLGIVFIVSAIMVIYYKQVSEGLEDRRRYEIMQKVGMTKKEIKDTIRAQTNTIFYLPLALAIIHLGFAFKMILKIMNAMSFTNTLLFLKCTLVTVAIFIVIYTIIYKLTSISYYKIITGQKNSASK